MDTEVCYYVQRCRACGNKSLETVLDLGEQYLPRFTKEIDVNLPRAPLELGRCKTCGLLQLRHTTDPDLLYRKFWYRSSINSTMRNALISVVGDGLKSHKKGVWVDIGANDGYLLSKVPDEFHKVAFEPAKNLADDLEEHADMVVVDYFKKNPEVAHLANVITSVAMFYDLDDPGRFLDDIRDTLARDGVWINQLNDAPTMMRQNAFDSICHEHLCYYDVPVLSKLYEEHGLTITKVSNNDVNGGSIRVEAKRSCDITVKPSIGEHLGVSRNEALEFAMRIMRWKENMRYLLTALSAAGPLWCYGASTKGTVLLQYLGCNDLFIAAADRNPEKNGLRMAGSWIPITSEVEFRKAGAKAALVLPWAFKDEFVKRERDTILKGTAFVLPLPNIEIEV
jgi:hypothetical protein